MKTLYSRILVAVFLALALIGCQSMPAVDTPGKRFAVFEISYQETLRTATLYAEEGRLSEDQIETLDQIFDQTTGLREAALRAWLADDMPEFDNRMQALSVVLQTTRAILVEAERHGK